MNLDYEELLFKDQQSFDARNWVLEEVARTLGVQVEQGLQQKFQEAVQWDKNVVLLEENSILLLPECLESSGW